MARADVTARALMLHLVQAAVNRCGRLDIAHNNADDTMEQFSKFIAVNLTVTGVFISMTTDIPQMLAPGGGSIK